MPNKHTVKLFAPNTHYHIYNRGVEKRTIFEDGQDYRFFLYLLKYYLSPLNQTNRNIPTNIPAYSVLRPRPLNNLEKEIDLLAYCLMPNHFHLLIKQKSQKGMSKLMKSIGTTYVMYFNKRYNRVGHLFQGIYKAAIIDTDSYLLHLSRYIHLNPVELTRMNPVDYSYSSYKNYLGTKKSDWVKPNFILNFFNKDKMIPYLKTYPSYEKFVEGFGKEDEGILDELTLE